MNECKFKVGDMVRTDRYLGETAKKHIATVVEISENVSPALIAKCGKWAIKIKYWAEGKDAWDFNTVTRSEDNLVCVVAVI